MTAQQREYLARIRGSQDHLLAIINDLLNYGRIEAGQLAYDIVEVSLRDVVGKVLPMVVPQASVKGLELTIEGHRRRSRCVRIASRRSRSS